MGGKKRREQPTMQLDAIVDDLEEVVAPDLRASLAPPPLPPKKAGTQAWIIGVAVVVIAGIAAAGIGLWLRSTTAEPTEPAPVTAPEPTASAEATEDDEAVTEEAAGAGAEEAPDVAEAPALQLEEFVFDESAAADEPEPSP